MLSNVTESERMPAPRKTCFGALLPPRRRGVTVDPSLCLDWPVCLHPSSQPSGRINLFFITLSVSVCLFTSSLPLPLCHCLCRSIHPPGGSSDLGFTLIRALHLTSRFIQSHSCIKDSIDNHFTSFNLLVPESGVKD